MDGIFLGDLFFFMLQKLCLSAILCDVLYDALGRGSYWQLTRFFGDSGTDTPIGRVVKSLFGCYSFDVVMDMMLGMVLTRGCAGQAIYMTTVGRVCTVCTVQYIRVTTLDAFSNIISHQT